MLSCFPASRCSFRGLSEEAQGSAQGQPFFASLTFVWDRSTWKVNVIPPPLLTLHFSFSSSRTQLTPPFLPPGETSSLTSPCSWRPLSHLSQCNTYWFYMQAFCGHITCLMYPWSSGLKAELALTMLIWLAGGAVCSLSTGLCHELNQSPVQHRNVINNGITSLMQNKRYRPVLL